MLAVLCRPSTPLLSKANDTAGTKPKVSPYEVHVFMDYFRLSTFGMFRGDYRLLLDVWHPE